MIATTMFLSSFRPSVFPSTRSFVSEATHSIQRFFCSLRDIWSLPGLLLTPQVDGGKYDPRAKSSEKDFVRSSFQSQRPRGVESALFLVLFEKLQRGFVFHSFFCLCSISETRKPARHSLGTILYSLVGGHLTWSRQERAEPRWLSAWKQ